MPVIDDQSFIDDVLCTVLENTPDLIFVKNIWLEYLAVSKSFLRLVGVSDKTAVLGKTNSELFDEESAKKYSEDELKVLETEKPIVDKVVVLHSADGEIKYSSVSRYLIKNSERQPVGLFGIGRDVSEKINLRNEADKATSAKTDFLARMSHDMRTPMNGIAGLIELSLDEKNPDVLHDNLIKMNMSAKYLMSLINDTLDMSKIEADKLTLCPEPLNSQRVIDTIVSSLHPIIEKKHLKFAVKSKGYCSNQIKADPVRIQQIFTNILSNAVKFTPDNGTIEAFLDYVSSDGKFDYYKITVRDTGVGMSEEFLPHVFEPFAQEENRFSSVYAGTGLGMPIVKRLVEMMDGKIEIRSKKNEGTEVSVWLRFERVGDVAVQKKSTQESAGLNGSKILICEDNSINIEIARRLLERKGCKVFVVENGEAGVRAFADSVKGYYDAVLMDIMMPVMDGLTAAAEIRRLGRSDAKAVPIIAMTANAYTEDAKESVAAGMNTHLSKPIEPELLYKTLSDYITMYRGKILL